MWEVTMVAAGASVQDLLWDSAGGGGPRGWCTWGFLHVHVTPHAASRLHAGRGPMFPCLRRPVPCKYPLLRPSRLCGSRPFSSPLSALRFLFPRNCSFAKAG